MPKKSNLPAVVHDHFRKANVLHGYVEKELGEARDHALEIGDELLAAKKAIPHGGWENECERLFDGSARTARFYMQFSHDMGALPKRQRTPLLFLEGTLDGAAKAARKLAKPKPPSKPKPPPPPDILDVDSEPVDDPPEETPLKPPDGQHEPPEEDAMESHGSQDEPGTVLQKRVATLAADWRREFPDEPACLARIVIGNLIEDWE